MKLVFGLYKYFPYGGLQRDMLAIARECAARGHQVGIFCQSWQGEYPSEPRIEINILPNRAFLWMGRSNHAKNARFRQQFSKAIKRIRPDRVICFNKIPGADIYYAADTCFKAKLYEERPWIYRWLPRYRQFVREEEALFAIESRTRILAIAQATQEEYRKFYQTPAERFTLLPPGISRTCVNTGAELSSVLQEELKLAADIKPVLMVGSGFRTKGLDRAISAIASLPESIKQKAHLVVVGEDNQEAFVEQAQQLGISDKISFLGGRKDVHLLLRSAALLIHPAYRENTGTVLLEAAVSGLPVITTAVCGYAHFIADHQLGVVLSLPFQQQDLNKALERALTDEELRKRWRENGLRFAQNADIYDMPKRAADEIERACDGSHR